MNKDFILQKTTPTNCKACKSSSTLAPFKQLTRFQIPSLALKYLFPIRASITNVSWLVSASTFNLQTKWCALKNGNGAIYLSYTLNLLK